MKTKKLHHTFLKKKPKRRSAYETVSVRRGYESSWLAMGWVAAGSDDRNTLLEWRRIDRLPVRPTRP